MMVGVVGFLGPEVVLSPVVSGCLPSCGGGCWLVWSASWALKWSCLPLSPVVSLHVGGGCWLVWSASWALKWSCLPLSPVVSLHVGGVFWLVWASWALKWSCLPLCRVVSGCGVGIGWCGRLLGL